MKTANVLILVVMGGGLMLAGCSTRGENPDQDVSVKSDVEATGEGGEGGPTEEPRPTHTPPLKTPSNIWQPEPGTTWQWQLVGEINNSWDVEMYDVDLFDTSAAVIEQLKSDGRVVICYFSAGSHEDWRPDGRQFPTQVIGEPLDEWPGERWLDIRQLDSLAPIMLARLELAASKGCHGVEPDNVDGYANEGGFHLSAENQIAYNRWLAKEAHARGLSVGLKNTLALIPNLVADFDWALNEQCFQYDECDALLPFIEANKAVFGVEYEGDPANYCPRAMAMRFSWLTKTQELADEPPGPCE